MSSETRKLSETSDRTTLLNNAFTSTMATHGRRATDVLLYSSAYLAIIAVAQVAITMVLLGLPLTPAPLVVGLVTFAVYANDRIADADTDSVSNPTQAAFARRHQGTLYVFAAGAYGLAIAVSVLGGPVALAITLLPGVFWILYASEWIPAVDTYFQRLKDVLIVNTTVVALAWALTLTFLPLAFANAPFTPEAGVVFVYFFLGIFVNTEIPNARDVEGDRAIGVETIPVVFGLRRTRQLLYGVDLLLIFLVGYAVLRGLLATPPAVALFVGLVYSLGVTAFLGRYADEGRLTIAAECEYAVVTVALILAVFAI